MRKIKPEEILSQNSIQYFISLDTSKVKYFTVNRTLQVLEISELDPQCKLFCLSDGEFYHRNFLVYTKYVNSQVRINSLVKVGAIYPFVKDAIHKILVKNIEFLDFNGEKIGEPSDIFKPIKKDQNIKSVIKSTKISFSKVTNNFEQQILYQTPNKEEDSFSKLIQIFIDDEGDFISNFKNEEKVVKEQNPKQNEEKPIHNAVKENKRPSNVIYTYTETPKNRKSLFVTKVKKEERKIEQNLLNVKKEKTKNFIIYKIQDIKIGGKYLLTANISEIIMSRKCFYEACLKCKSKLRADLYGYKCEKCNILYRDDEVSYRYNLYLKIKDCSGEYMCLMNDECANKLLGFNANIFRESVIEIRVNKDLEKKISKEIMEEYQFIIARTAGNNMIIINNFRILNRKEAAYKSVDMLKKYRLFL